MQENEHSTIFNIDSEQILNNLVRTVGENSNGDVESVINRVALAETSYFVLLFVILSCAVYCLVMKVSQHGRDSCPANLSSLLTQKYF